MPLPFCACANMSNKVGIGFSSGKSSKKSLVGFNARLKRLLPPLKARR
jgi:hypothetical protein